MPDVSASAFSNAAADRLASIFAGKFVARGVAIDDEAQDLMDSIEKYSEDQGTPIRIRTIVGADESDFLGRVTRNSDFVLVDHRLQGRFKGFDEGLEVLKSVRAQNERQPVFYCSAFSRDFQKKSSGKFEFLDGAVEKLMRSPHTFYYPKHDLNPEGRLKEFTQAVYWQAFGYAMHNLLGDPQLEEVRALLTTRQVRKEVRFFKVLNTEARGRTRVREVTEARIANDEVVPSRLLKRAGARGKSTHAEHVIIEFASGHVLSHFKPAHLEGERISRQVIEALSRYDGDD